MGHMNSLAHLLTLNIFLYIYIYNSEITSGQNGGEEWSGQSVGLSRADHTSEAFALSNSTHLCHF